MSNGTGTNTLPQLLTLIITTSPIPSAPSTDLLQAALDSFRVHCKSLLDIDVIVVFDAHEQVTSTARLKKGYVTEKGIQDYEKYKANCRRLFLSAYDQESEPVFTQRRGEAEFGSPNSTTPVPYSSASTENGRVTFIDVEERRLGFGLAVRTALRMVTTPYVWVHQHDWALLQPVPVASIIRVMQSAEMQDQLPIKYICLPSVRGLSYATSNKVIKFPELKKLTSSLTRDYTSPEDTSVSIPLTPMYFWHDRPHIVLTEHYLQRVFPTRLAMLRGAFIEDTIGQRARKQMKEGQWEKWATWIYNPGGGTEACLRHLQGRTRAEQGKQTEESIP